MPSLPDRRPYFRLRDDLCVELQNVTQEWRASRPDWIDFVEMEKASWVDSHPLPSSTTNATMNEVQRPTSDKGIVVGGDEAKDALNGWASVRSERRRNVMETMEAVKRGERKLTHLAVFEKLIAESRRGEKETFDLHPHIPRRLPRLWIVQPKIVYCPLLSKDGPRLGSFVSRVREAFRENELEIVRVNVDDKVPLCEVYVTGPVLHNIQVLYARGGTLQWSLPFQLRTGCATLTKSGELRRIYGGDGFIGGFPVWNEEKMFRYLVDILRPSFEDRHTVSAPDTEIYFEPINFPMHNRRIPNVLHNIHFKTRQAVQKAFENGVEDYRVVIENKYKLLQEAEKEYIDDSQDRDQELRRLHQDTWGQGYSLD